MELVEKLAYESHYKRWQELVFYLEVQKQKYLTHW